MNGFAAGHAKAPARLQFASLVETGPDVLIVELKQLERQEFSSGGLSALPSYGLSVRELPRAALLRVSMDFVARRAFSIHALTVIYVKNNPS